MSHHGSFKPGALNWCGDCGHGGCQGNGHFQRGLHALYCSQSLRYLQEGRLKLRSPPPSLQAAAVTQYRWDSRWVSSERGQGTPSVPMGTLLTMVLWPWHIAWGCRMSYIKSPLALSDRWLTPPYSPTQALMVEAMKTSHSRQVRKLASLMTFPTKLVLASAPAPHLSFARLEHSSHT